MQLHHSRVDRLAAALAAIVLGLTSAATAQTTKQKTASSAETQRDRPQPSTAASVQLWAKKHYSSWDNPLHSELTINGTTINIFTSDTMEPIGQQLKEGWNVITLKTTPQEPANRNNGLLFRIGPTHKDSKNNKVIMQPVLWEFRNDTDWKFNDGRYSHPLGPGVKEVTLTFNLYWAGFEHENRELKAGDYVLVGKPGYSSWNSPVFATVFINDTPLSSFTLADRQVVITPLLKEGKNEVKLISTRVRNSIKDNDISFEISGPAEWNVSRNQFVVTPVAQFKSKQGWTLEPKTGMLVNQAQPNSETVERVIPFFVKQLSKPGGH